MRLAQDEKGKKKKVEKEPSENGSNSLTKFLE